MRLLLTYLSWLIHLVSFSASRGSLAVSQHDIVFLTEIALEAVLRQKSCRSYLESFPLNTLELTSESKYIELARMAALHLRSHLPLWGQPTWVPMYIGLQAQKPKIALGSPVCIVLHIAEEHQAQIKSSGDSFYS